MAKARSFPEKAAQKLVADRNYQDLDQLVLNHLNEVAGVDLTDGGGPVDLATTVADLPACRVVILGCLDSDDNDCELHDAITLPNDNGFLVLGGASTPVQVFLGLLNPS